MRRLFVLFALVLSLLALAACGGGGGGAGTPTNVHTPIPGNYVPLILTENAVVGDNRFVVGVLKAADNSAVVGAQLHERFFKLSADNTGSLAFELDATTIQATKSYVDTHPDGTHEVHQAGDTGAYVSHVTFDAAGNWAVEVTGTTKDGVKLDAVRLTFQVHATDPGIAIGSPIPASKQTILSDVSDISKIDTSLNPIPEEHTMTVAQALANGKPTIIAFATPAYCQSQICGPTKDIFDDMYNLYKGQANFVHIEPYDVARMAAGQCPNLGDCAVGATVDFKLQSEPWVFVAGSHGILRAKFEGIVSEDELKAAIQAVLGTGASASATP